MIAMEIALKIIMMIRRLMMMMMTMMMIMIIEIVQTRLFKWEYKSTI